MKTFLIFIFTSTLFNTIIAQEITWKGGINGAGEIYVMRSVIDNQNNVYIFGRFDNTIKSPAALTSRGGKDLFLAKYSYDGTFEWIKQIGGTSTEQGNGIVIDKEGNLIVTGKFLGTCYFDDIPLTSSGSADIFLAKYSPSGTLVWASNVGTGSTYQGSQNLAIDSNDNLVMVGSFASTIDLLGTNLTDNTATYTNFIAKFDKNVNLLWAKKIINKSPNSFLYGISCSNNGYYFSASLIDTIYLDIAKVGSKKNLSNNYSTDILLYKTDFNGNGLWYSKIGGTGEDANISTESDPLGNVYVTGYFNSLDLQVDSISSKDQLPAILSKKTSATKGFNDIFFAKYSSEGVLQWFNSHGSVNDDKLNRLSTNGGHIVIAGQFAGKMSINNETIEPIGGTDALGVVHDSNDNLLYSITAGGTGTDIAQTCLIDKEGNYIFIGDYTSPTITFDTNHSLTNPDPGSDIFIAKYKSRSISFSIDTIKCSGTATGGITANAKGAWVGDKTYAWTKVGDANFSANTQTIDVLSAGTYNCTISDDLYTETSSVTMVDPTPLSASENLASHKNAKCYGAVNGALALTVSGGTGTKNIVWSGDGTGIIATNSSQNAVSAGTYNAIVTDANGCTAAVNNMVVTQPDKVTFKNTDVVKINGAEGSVDLQVQGGTPAFTYSWSGPSGYTASTKNISSLTVAGNYKVTLTDLNLCNADTTVLIVDSHAQLYAFISQKTDVKCFDASTGSLTVATQTNDPSPSFTYAWTGPDGFTASTATITGIKAGSYDVTVKDVTPDPDYTYTITGIVITQPASALTVNVTKGDITCFGLSNGYIDADALGGTFPYTYQWKKNGDLITNTAEVLTSLGSGNYELSVSDAGGCNATATASLVPPPPITVNSAVVTPLTCNGTKNDGAIALNVSGGTGTYTYRWSNGLTGSNISLLGAGTYSCVITDVNKCSIPTKQTVSQPSVITASFTNTNVSCFGGSTGAIDLTPAGGNTGAYTFKWSNNQVTEDLSGLAVGSYTVTIADSKKCEKSFTTSITQPAAALNVTAVSVTNANCNGTATGSITVASTGGTSPYLFSWSNSRTGATNGGLVAGNYTVTVTDSKSCTKDASFTITEPTALSISEVIASHTNLLCNGLAAGGLEVSATGSTGAYEYSLAGATWQTSPVFSNLAAGDYNVMVRDQSITSCQKTIASPIVISQPAALVFTSPTAVNITCNGLTNGTISAAASGGTGALLYKLKLDGTETTNISGASSGLFTGLVSGAAYTVEVADANNCKLNSNNLSISEPQKITLASAVATNITCWGLTNGAVNAQASGGTDGLVYKLLLNDVETGNITGASSGNFTGLSAGTTYKVAVTDINNCGPVESSVLSIASPPPVTVGNITATNITCSGLVNGRVDIQAAGGTGAYSYKLLLNSTPTANVTGASSGSFTGLSAGTGYTVEINDANNCGPWFSSIVNIQEPDPIVIASQTTARTSGSALSDGSINIIASGGTGSLSFSLNTGPPQSTGTFTGLAMGTYLVSITDANSCGPVSSNSLVVGGPTSVGDLSGAKIRLYPNPVSERVFVEVKNHDFKELKIELKNISGQASLTQRYEHVGDGFVADIDLNRLPKGIYVILVNNMIMKDKLIVQ